MTLFLIPRAILVVHAQICCKSRETCVAVCTAGLDYLHNTFEFVRDGRTYKLSEAMRAITSSFPDQTTVVGTGPKSSALVVPYRCAKRGLDGAYIEREERERSRDRERERGRERKEKE